MKRVELLKKNNLTFVYRCTGTENGWWVIMQEGSVTMVTPGYEAAGNTLSVAAGDAGFTQPDQAQFEADKRAVYKLVFVFEIFFFLSFKLGNGGLFSQRFDEKTPK